MQKIKINNFDLAYERHDGYGYMPMMENLQAVADALKSFVKVRGVIKDEKRGPLAGLVFDALV